MKTVWTQGASPEKKKEIRDSFNAGAHLRERLKQLLIEKVESSARKSRVESGYENPNWAYLQADARGYERALFEVISLIQ